ncbi:MAG: protein-L-isoaspartate(D-aspartate) O-methyltransferase, partial [Planctomycetaceae bacterium]|nr:protein-L-isoaspartate(D-aspartate) O-methyltransferase [Planctomycetaceae bacterium]
LAEGGRMIIPLGERYQQVFHLFEKQDGQLVATRLQPTLFVPMTGKSENLREVKPDPLNPQLVNGGFEETNPETGRFDHWHYQRRSSLMTDGAPQGQHYICFENDEAGRTAHVLQAFAIDGSQIEALTMSAQYLTTDVRPGRTPSDRPSLTIHFYDQRRLPIGTAALGPWKGDTPSWTSSHDRIEVPRNAREAIVQLGLNGATGTLCVDDVQMTPDRR